jgi:hypothetical protein
MLTITKIKPQLSQAELLSEIAEEIDAFGLLAEEAQPIIDQIAKLQLKLKPMADAKKLLEAKIDKMPIPDDCDGHVEKGVMYEAAIGKRGSSRSIKDMEEVKTALGESLFMSLATVKLGDIDAYLTPEEKAVVLEVTRTAHSVKVSRRP